MIHTNNLQGPDHIKSSVIEAKEKIRTRADFQPMAMGCFSVAGEYTHLAFDNVKAHGFMSHPWRASLQETTHLGKNQPLPHSPVYTTIISNDQLHDQLTPFARPGRLARRRPGEMTGFRRCKTGLQVYLVIPRFPSSMYLSKVIAL